jgi:uncharacterized protein
MRPTLSTAPPGDTALAFCALEADTPAEDEVKAMGSMIYPRALALFGAVLGAIAVSHNSFCQAAPMDKQHVENWERFPTLTVTGHGTVNARPDRGIVQLGVEAQGDTAESAQQGVNGSMQKVVGAIQKLGIEAHSIQTTGIRLTPVYAAQTPGKESEPPHILGYRASNTIRVELSDLGLVGKVIDAGTQAGANRVEGISFEVQNDSEYRAQALAVAAKKARNEARALANALGIKLGPVWKVNQVAVSAPRPMYSYGAYGGGARFAAVATPVEPGQIAIEASVTVAYRTEMGK